MRTTLIRPLSIVLVLILAAVLTPVGTNASEAKSGSAALWQVAIPRSGVHLNLTGLGGSTGDDAVFEDQGFRGPVRVNLSKTKVGGVLNYAFTLLFAPGTTDYGVGINGVSFDPGSVSVTAGETPCGFADRDSCSTQAPQCMECFLEGSHPYDRYDFSLQVATDEDVENQALAGGRLFLDMWDYNDPTGAYHRLSCSSDRKRVSIARSGDVWTITNRADTYLSCEEYYLVTQGRAKSVKHTVMTATTYDPFVFKTTWTSK